MTAADLCYLPAADLSSRIERRALSSVDLIAALLDRIERYNDTLHSYITVCPETALREAREAEREIAAGAPPNIGRFTVPSNLTGYPSLSVPCGFAAGRLPVGMQLIGKAFDEGMLFRIGHAYEQHAGWHRRHPALEVAA